MCFHKCIVLCVYHDNIIQQSFRALKITPASYQPVPKPNLCQPFTVLLSLWFAFSKIVIEDVVFSKQLLPTCTQVSFTLSIVWFAFIFIRIIFHYIEPPQCVCSSPVERRLSCFPSLQWLVKLLQTFVCKISMDIIINYHLRAYKWYLGAWLLDHKTVLFSFILKAIFQSERSIFYSLQ